MIVLLAVISSLNLISEKALISAIGIVIAFLGVCSFFLDNHINKEKDKISKLKEKANAIAGGLRNVGGNFWNLPLKSNSAFLQELVDKMPRQELQKLLESDFFKENERRDLIAYFNNYNHEPN